MLTGFGLTVTLPDMPGVSQRSLVIDQPVAGIRELREKLKERLPHSIEFLDDHSLGIAVNGRMLVASETTITLKDGDPVDLVPQLAGG